MDTQQLPSKDRRKSTGSDHQLWRFSYAVETVETSKAFKSFSKNGAVDLPRMMIHHPNFGLGQTNLLLGDTREVPSRAVRFRQTITEVEVPFVLTF